MIAIRSFRTFISRNMANISSFLIFCCYFTRLKVREISQQNMRNSEDIGYIVLGTLRQLMHISKVQNVCNLISRQEYNNCNQKKKSVVFFFLSSLDK